MDERTEKIERYALAVEWLIEHPEAPVDSTLRSYVEMVRKKVEEKAGESALDIAREVLAG